MTALPALKAARPALLRPWRLAVWRDQDYWTWLLVILGALILIRLLVLVFGQTDLFFDEAQYWSFSSLLISTDVPLLLFWTLAFYGWIRMIESREMRFAVLIGASLGLGLLAMQRSISCCEWRLTPGATRAHARRCAEAAVSRLRHLLPYRA